MLSPSTEARSKRIARIEFQPPLVQWFGPEPDSSDLVLSVTTNDGKQLANGVRVNKLSWFSSWNADDHDYSKHEDRTLSCTVSLGASCHAVVVARATVALDPPPSRAERYPDERRALAALARWALDDGPVRERAASSIQLAWRRCSADPTFFVCHRRLLREASECILPARCHVNTGIRPPV